MEKINLEKNIEDSSYQGNDTILVWLDFGPYSYIHLGIISELNKLKKYDFIGIVTKHQDLSYFQNQKFIQFKELFYYPEYYIGKSNNSQLRIVTKFSQISQFYCKQQKVII